MGPRDRAGRPLALRRQRRLLRRHGPDLPLRAAAGLLSRPTPAAAVLRFGPVEIAFDDTVLRPRPWTLAQSEWAAELASGRDAVMLELGSGAGQIGLAAAALSGCRLVQVDRDPGACRWAAQNAAANGLGHLIEQRCGTAEEVLRDEERFGVVIADPPYVPTSDVHLYPEDPLAAIDGGPDGLDSVRAFVLAVAGHLAAGGSIIIQVRGQAQVDRLGDWLDEPASPPLELVDGRSYGERRALARLGVRPT